MARPLVTATLEMIYFFSLSTDSSLLSSLFFECEIR
jgi:hypothetical protein